MLKVRNKYDRLMILVLYWLSCFIDYVQSRDFAVVN